MTADVELEERSCASAFFIYFCPTGGKFPLALKRSISKNHFEYVRNVLRYFRKERLRSGERGD